MPIDPDQKEIIARSNHRLAIVGLFDPENKGKIFEFAATGGDGPFTASALFQALKPKVVAERNQRMTIGGREFNGYRLLTPRAAASLGITKLNCQELAIDSLLLDPPAGSAAAPEGVVQRLVKKGEKLFADLVENLDLAAPFTYSGFSRSLQDFARAYILRAVAWNQPGEQLSQATWDQRFFDSLSLAGGILGYLLCCEPDEPAMAAELLAILNREAIYSGPLQANIVKALRQCRQSLLKVGEAEDAVCREIATWTDWKWVVSFGSDPDRGFAHPSLPAGGSFAQYYRVLMNASGEVHRLLRTEAVHPQMVIWLASLYVDGDLDGGRLWEAAQKMFELGVERHRGKGIAALPAEVLEDFTHEIRQAKATIHKSLNQEQEERLAAAQGSVVDIVSKPLIASRKITTEFLKQQAVDLFTTLGQLVSGALGEILRDVEQDVQAFVPLLQQLLALRQEDLENVPLLLDERLPGLSLVANEAADLRAAVLVALDAAPNDRWAPARGLVRHLAVRAKTQVATAYYRDLGQIDKQAEDLQTLYRFRIFSEIESKQGVPGRPLVILGEQKEVSPAAAAKQLETKAGWLQSLRGKVKAAAKSSPPKFLPGGEEPFPEGPAAFPVESGGQTVAELVRQEGQGQLELKVPDLDQLDKVTSSSALVVFPGGRKVPLLDLNLENIDSLRTRKNEIDKDRKFKATDLAALQTNLTETIDRLAAIAADREGGPLGQEVRGAFRALLLAEHILAAPEDATTLGLNDLSGALALLVHMVEHLAREPRSLGGEHIPTTAFSRDPQNLGRIQLGKLFPVLTAHDLHEILIYHRTLGEGLGDTGLQRFLAETRALRELFGSVESGSALEIQVVNDDLPSFAGQSKHDYGVLYLTAQASPGGAEVPTDIGEGVTQLAQALAAKVAQSGQFPVIPLVFVDGLGAGAGALPILDGSALKLRLAAGFDPGSSGIQLAVEMEKKKPQALALPIGLATAAAPHLSRKALGSLAKPLSAMTIRQFVEAGLTVPPDGEEVVAILKELWNTKGIPVVANYLLARWLTLAIAARQREWTRRTAFDQEIGNGIEAELAALGPGERDDLLALVNRTWRAAEIRLAQDPPSRQLLPPTRVSNQSLRCIFGVARPGEEAMEVLPAWQKSFRETLI